MTQQQALTTFSLDGDRAVVLSRLFDAPRELVFEAFTDCKHLRNWWGPRNLELVSCEMDFRVGGTWRFVQRDAQGNEFAFRGEYREIVRPERIVQTNVFELVPDHMSIETVVLEDRDGKTLLTMRSEFDTPEARDMAVQANMEAGATETYERLAEYLRTL